MQGWLKELSADEFKQSIVPAIDAWFGEPPEADEDVYRSTSSTAEGAAFKFFSNFEYGELEAIGVSLVDGDAPGSDYQGAELNKSIAAANKAAESEGIPVRFVAIDGYLGA